MTTVKLSAPPLHSEVVRPLVAALALVLAVPIVGACNKETGGDVGVPQSTTVQVGDGPVTIKGIAFNPKEVHVKAGQQLLWNWEDGGLEHSVTADDKSFNSGRRTAGSWPYTFAKAGTYAYHCEVHARMHGTVVVSG
jgi:plastocyanin